MTKFDDFINTLSTGVLTEDRVKSEIKKMTVAAKLADNPGMNNIYLSLQEEGVGIIQYLIMKNKIEILDVVLRLSDKTLDDEIKHLLSASISEVITSSNIAAYDIIVKHLAEQLKEIEDFVKHKALISSTYRFIMHVFQKKMNDFSQDAVLEIAQNKNDLAYLLNEFPIVTLMNAVDAQNNNILHLALQSHNKNIFRYVVNHAGIKLLYEKNSNDVTPIDMVYADIQAKAEITKTPNDYSQLMLLDQAGADLATNQYVIIRQAYQAIPEYHHRFLLAKQVKPVKEVTAVSFNGGGAKGQAFIAAYREALDHHVIEADKVRQYAGTSAGAITAGIFALNFDIIRCQKELKEFEFKKLMSYPTSPEINVMKEYHVKRWVEYFQQGAYYYLISDILAKVATESLLWSGPVMASIRQLASTVTGIFKPTYLRETLERLVKERIAGTALQDIHPAHITFKDLKENPDIFKELIVYITNLSTGSTEKCSAETTPTMSIIDGIVYSASFPIFFEAAQKFEIVTNEQGTRERKEVRIDNKLVWCCDGGVLKNDPVDAFDVDRFNENTLTFMLVSSDAKKTHEADGTVEHHETKSAVQVMTQLFKISRSVERKRVHEDMRNYGRIVYIDTKNVGTLDFDNTELNGPVLDAAGQDAVIDYLHRRTANGYSTLRPETISLLMSYKVAKLSTTGGGQVVEINPGKKLDPMQILRIYAAATHEELYMLRSIINPNQRDGRGVSAIDIATQLKLVETKQRLQVAGARPAVENIQLTRLPRYMQRGEEFLKTTVSDEDLTLRASLMLENERLRIEKQGSQIILANRQKFGKDTFLQLVFEKFKTKLNLIRNRKLLEENQNLDNINLMLQAEIHDNSDRFQAEKEVLQSTFQITIECNQRDYEAKKEAIKSELQGTININQENYEKEQNALQSTINCNQQSFETEKVSLSKQNSRLQTMLETIQDEKVITDDGLKIQQRANTLLSRKYYFSRNSSSVKKSLDNLRIYKITLAKEIDKDNVNLLNSGLAAILGVYKSYLEANLKLKKAKMFGIDEVLDNITKNYDQSASQIIQAAKQNHPGFFNGFFSQRAKALCKQMITVEENIGKACGR